MTTNPFTFVEAVSFSKQNILAESPELEKDYPSYIVNKSLSYHSDAILYANEINMYQALDKRLQFDYYLNSIKSRKRYAKWVKKSGIGDELAVIKEYYNCSDAEAEEIMSILSPDDISDLKSFLNKGGR